MLLSGQSQPIPCDDSYYLFLVPHSNATTSSMYRITLDAAGIPNYELVNDDLGHWVTAAGYSIMDRQIYALDYNTLELLRIDARGNVTTLRVPPGLDTTNVFTAGETSAAGRRLFVIGRDAATGHDKTLFSVRLYAEDFSAGRVSILSDNQAALEDFAFDPVRGTLYGYDDTNNKLIWLDPLSGRVSDYFSRNMSGVGRLGSLFFDKKGALHAYGAAGGTEEGVYFNIDKLQGKPERVAEGPKGRFSDGCACPYRIRSFKTVSPQRAFPCSEVTIQYTVVNHAGTSYSYLQFSDTLPAELVITEIVEQPLTSTVTSGVGSNIFTLEDIDLLLDTNLITIKARVREGAVAGSYASSAYLQELSEGLGRVLPTDNPATPLSFDATAIEIMGGQDLQLENHQQFACDGGGFTLSTGIEGATYQWSTGDTTATLFVQTAGQYDVTVTTECGVYQDSIDIPTIPQPLTLEFDPLSPIETGQTIELIPRLTTQRSLLYHWQSEAALDCVDCPTLSVRPFRNMTYYLTISDEFGCMASDSVQVQVQAVRHMYFPDAFSPNNDGYNDVFYLQGLAGSATIEQFQVFDRWGNMLFETSDVPINAPQYGWDGRAEGRPLEAGTYVWVAQVAFPDGSTERFSGAVTLVK